MNLVCLDIEATDKGEILELSIIRFVDKVEVYHSYFKPVYSKHWSNDVHHITTDMVKDAPVFINEKRIVQKILDEADGIIGFATHNDLKYLSDGGIIIPDNKRIIELQNWIWHYKGKELGIDLCAVPRLSKCAEMFGLNFSEELDAHSATNDTLITLAIFEQILSCNLNGDLDKFIKDFDQIFDAEKENYYRTKAKGILILEISENGYILKNYAIDTTYKGEYSIYVESRYTAEHEIRVKFKKREIPTNIGVYKLKGVDFEFFKNYKNEYDASREEFYRHIYNAKKSKKKKLNFNLK